MKSTAKRSIESQRGEEKTLRCIHVKTKAVRSLSTEKLAEMARNECRCAQDELTRRRNKVAKKTAKAK